MRDYVAFAGRPWPEEKTPEAHRAVGRFASMEAARRAYGSIQFRELPQQAGRRRWRGEGPATGMMVQIEQAVPELQSIA